MPEHQLRCLVADPENACPPWLAEQLKRKELSVRTANTAEAARALLAEFTPEIAFFDLQIINDHPDLPAHPALDDCETLIMGSEDEADTVQRAMRDGASYFFRKDSDDIFVRELLEDVICEFTQRSKPAPEMPEPPGQFGLMRGNSKPMRRLYRTLRKVAGGDVSVLLVGESGTGKEVAAHTLHNLSPRAEAPFVTVNCGAIAPTLIESQLFGHEKGSFSGATKNHCGFFECADKGTLFLDEITEMPLELQVKLLRTLETGLIRRLGSEHDVAVDVRIIAATNRQPEQAIADEILREDLYYRIAGIPISLPPLRERGEDKVALAQHFLNGLNEENKRQTHFSAEALAKIASMSWPGNVRELSNAVDRAYLLSNGVIEADAITEDVIPAQGAGEHLRISVGETLENSEKKLIFATLEANDGNKKATARALGISLKTLYNRLNEYREHSTDTEPNDETQQAC